MATIKDVAKRAGVSYTTVSHVINETRFVSEDVVKRVNKAIRELKYRPNQVARCLRKQESKTIGVLSSINVNPYFSETLTGIEKKAYLEGYNIIVCYSECNPEKEKENIEMLLDKGVDAVIIHSLLDETRIPKLVNLEIPVLFLQHYIENSGMDAICTDDFMGGYLAAKHFIELGHTKIACVSAEGNDNFSYRQRIKGWEKALNENDIELNQDYIIETDFHTHAGYDSFIKFAKMKVPPTAIFFYSDNLAIGGIRAAADINISVPDQISVIGFDDLFMCQYTVPRLTTVYQPKFSLGEMAFARIFERIKDKELKPKKQFVEPKLVIRESTRRRV